MERLWMDMGYLLYYLILSLFFLNVYTSKRQYYLLACMWHWEEIPFSRIPINSLNWFPKDQLSSEILRAADWIDTF